MYQGALFFRGPGERTDMRTHPRQGITYNFCEEHSVDDIDILRVVYDSGRFDDINMLTISTCCDMLRVVYGRFAG